MNVADKRGAVEQILENKENILKHFKRDEVLADFGIRIIGQLETVDELYLVPQEGLQYGDAYAVGAQSPFTYYIWTRANNLSPSDYWFDFGEIAIAGPQGPKGDRGEKGATGQSTRWYLMSDAAWSYDATGKKPGDMVLLYPSGNVHMMGDSGYFTAVGNIRGPVGPKGDKGLKGDTGPQGPQGPQGPTGDVGGFINIGGVVHSEYELPDPEVIQNLTVAFLVGAAEPYELYIQVGSTSATAEWMNMGFMNVATYITVNGQFQNTWDADTKLDKVSTRSNNNMVYVKSMNGSQIMTAATSSPAAWAIPTYDGEGNLKTEAPVEFKDCVNLEYFNANAGGGWKVLRNDSMQQSGSFYLPTELQGHHINIIITIDYHNFMDYGERHTAFFGPTPWRLEGKKLSALSRTLQGFSDDSEAPNPTIELSASGYGDIDFDGAYIWFTASKGNGTDFYTPEVVLYYQDLGPSFVSHP